MTVSGCGVLTCSLAGAPSGLDFVYQALDQVVIEHGARDALLVVDGSPLGRQVFRSGRQPLERSWAADLAHRAPAGLYLEPATEVGGDVGSSLVSLAAIALRLDVLAHDAAHDSLTGLYNRRSFEELLSQAIAQSHRYHWGFALVVIDVDQFKALNDRFGHAAGDATLRAVGDGLRASLRAGDAAARLGGDEFAVLLSNATPDAVPALLGRLKAAVGHAVPGIDINFSAGMARAPDDAEVAEELSRIADDRLYQAKGR